MIKKKDVRRMIRKILRFLFELCRRFIILAFDYDIWLLTPRGRRSKAAQSSDTLNYEEKAQQIEKCLNSSAVDLWKLRELALSKGGLLEAKYRKRAWLKLVGLDDDEEMAFDVVSSSLSSEKENVINQASVASPTSAGSYAVEIEEEKKTECPDGDLIRRDVGRSVLFRYSNTACNNNDFGGALSPRAASASVPSYASERLAMALEDTIRRSGNTKLHYYQGLHDVAGVILHNMDYHTNATISILSKLCQSHFRDAMRENFGNVTWLLSLLMLPLVEKVEYSVYEVLQIVEIDLSNVCLPWVITWFTHDMHHAETAGRLVDMFLSSHPLLPIYFAVAVITHPVLKQMILTADLDDPALLFSLIKKMPISVVSDLDDSGHSAFSSLEAKVPVQELLEDAMSIMKRIPPRDLLLLVDKRDLYSREDLLQRASSISMFKAVPSWSIEGGQLMGTTGGESSEEIAVATSTTILSADSSIVRAKLASGIPILQDTVKDSAVTNNPNWGSQRYLVVKNNKKKKKLFRKPKIFQTIRRKLFGQKRKQQITTSVT